MRDRTRGRAAIRSTAAGLFATFNVGFGAGGAEQADGPQAGTIKIAA